MIFHRRIFQIEKLFHKSLRKGGFCCSSSGVTFSPWQGLVFSWPFLFLLDLFALWFSITFCFWFHLGNSPSLCWMNDLVILHYFISWNHKLIIPYDLPAGGAGFRFPFSQQCSVTVSLLKLTNLFLRQRKKATTFWIFLLSCTSESKSCLLILNFVLISKSLGPCNRVFDPKHHWMIFGISKGEGLMYSQI